MPPDRPRHERGATLCSNTCHPREAPWSARNAVTGKALLTVAGAGDATVLFWVDPRQRLRVSPATADGIATSPDGIEVAGGVRSYAARCNRERCLTLTFQGTPSPAATLITPSGEPVTKSFALPPVSLAGADDGGFLLAGGLIDFHAIRLDNRGRQTFDTIVQFGPPPGAVTADFDGARYSLAWSGASSAGPAGGNYAASLTLAGELGLPRQILVLDPATTSSSSGRLVWNGREHLYAYALADTSIPLPELLQPTTLHLLRLDRNLEPIGQSQALPAAASGSSVIVDFAVNRGLAYLGWNESFGFFGAQNVMRGARIDGNGAIALSTGLAVAPLSQRPEAIASADDVTVALYSELDTNLEIDRFHLDGQLRFVRVTRGGTILDAEPRLMSAAMQTGRVAASANGSDVLVVWSEDPFAGRPLQAAIVHTGDGSFDRLSIPIVDSTYGLAVAANGSNWLVADGPQFVIVSRTGLVLNPTPVRYATSPPYSISVASDGDRYLLAWEDDTSARQRGMGPARIALVDSDGSVTSTDTILEPNAYSVSAVFTGRDYLVASTTLKSTRVTRVSTSGVAGPIATIAATIPSHLTVFGTGALATFDRGNELAALRLTADPSLIDATSFTIPFRHLTSTATRTIIGLGVVPIDAETNAVVLQELTSSQPALRRPFGHP
ncbi:MAG: hypothetical protein JWO56_2813 [Acidobacteria bacterium]|nr:hypothetical protein [Acidobacteriota bacterium]